MGNDGGSIPTRRELVKSAALPPTTTELKATQQEALAHAWSTCPLSDGALAPPIVSDYQGTLYNKEAVLAYLLSADSAEEATPKDAALLHNDAHRARRKEQTDFLDGRVTSLKDVVEVRFTYEGEHEPPGGAAQRLDALSDDRSSTRRIVCPITRKQLGPAIKSVYLVPCGHAFSEVAVREIGSAECGVCGQAMEVERDTVVILPTTEAEKQRARDRAAKLREVGLSHALKKVGGKSGGKKRRRKADVDEPAASPADGSVMPIEGGAHDEIATIKPGDSSTSESQTTRPVPSAPLGSQSRAASSKTAPPNLAPTTIPSKLINNAATASLTARVLAEQAAHTKRRRRDLNDNLRTLYQRDGDATVKAAQGGADFMTRGFSIPRKKG